MGRLLGDRMEVTEVCLRVVQMGIWAGGSGYCLLRWSWLLKGQCCALCAYVSFFLITNQACITRVALLPA